MSPRTFRAMGVDVVVGGAGESSVDAVRELVDEREARFSRFRPDSELSRVNAARSQTVVVSEPFARAIRAALSAAAVTSGLVDPTLGAALEAAGYDRDFELLAADGRAPGPTTPGRWREVSVVGRILSRPVGTVLDLNGVVKAMAVDDALASLPAPSFVAAGGDLATSGPVVVGLPEGGSVRIDRGGIATTGTTYRHWSRGGVEQHHLIDPLTGHPARTRWEVVTVAAATCLAADVAAKAAFLLSDAGPDWLDERGLPGRFVAAGSVLENRTWARLVDSEAVAA